MRKHPGRKRQYRGRHEGERGAAGGSPIGAGKRGNPGASKRPPTTSRAPPAAATPGVRPPTTPETFGNLRGSRTCQGASCRPLVLAMQHVLVFICFRPVRGAPGFKANQTKQLKHQLVSITRSSPDPYTNQCSGLCDQGPGRSGIMLRLRARSAIGVAKSRLEGIGLSLSLLCLSRGGAGLVGFHPGLPGPSAAGCTRPVAAAG